ncbi:hypothetical protein C8F04DRAFT_1186738 [Mycena alexandri]|uniref:Uncharacterized protein n=1 Tax=Mycena alexandri TaxID=1745969 RepID=A0AAD6SML7_9AGAR|nr:hypothetical protein C8F04DRAFT_1186738 [Mycena alexandri]
MRSHQASDEESVTSSDERVYFSVPKTHGYQIFEAQCTVPSIRKARREIFDGVHVPLWGGMKKGEIRDLTGKGKEKVNEPGKAGPSSVPGPAPLPDPKRQPPNRKVPLSRGLDNLQLIEARKVRLEKDTEMRDVEEQEDPAKKSAIKGDVISEPRGLGYGPTKRSDTFRTGSEGRTERNQRPGSNDEDRRAG